jgi:hypothetical protein
LCTGHRENSEESLQTRNVLGFAADLRAAVKRRWIDGLARDRIAGQASGGGADARQVGAVDRCAIRRNLSTIP